MILHPDAMRAVEAAWFAGGNASYDLMRRAARAVADAVLVRAGGGRVLVACGPGNNGGDGWLAAAMLREAGCDVTVASLVAPDALRDDAARAAAEWGGDWSRDFAASGCAVAVDALFGIGLSRALEGKAAAAVAALNASGAAVVAVDVPSGVDAATGAVPGVAVRAVETVAFHTLKPGHVFHPGRGLCGVVRVADIGLPMGGTARLAEAADWFVPVPGASSHKYARGGLAVWSGPEFSTGASRLAAVAALRAGAGAVWLAGEAAALRVHSAHVTAVMLREADAAGFGALLADGKVRAALVGPGAGPQARAVAEVALTSGRAVVLDADALTAFAGDAVALRGLVRGEVLLTPHAGELARLMPELGGVQPLEAAAAAAQATGAVVLLKGATTVVAAPDGRVRVCVDAPAWLATIGTGDVLAGIAGAMLAQGLDALAAGVGAASVHAEAARRAGPWLVADDLEARIAGVLRDAAGL